MSEAIVRNAVTGLVGVALAALTLAGCGGDDGDNGDGGKTDRQPSPSTSKPAVSWPAPPDPLQRAVEAGLEPDVKEHHTNHVHAHLDVFVDGTPVTVPSGIGINTDDPDVRTFPDADGSTGYGGIDECRKPCISPLHTHDATGVIHTESATPEPNTLGEFFIEWGVRLDDSCVGEYCNPEPIAFYLNGEPYTQDPRAIELTDHLEIAVVIGTPPPEIPETADFSGA